MEFKMSVVFTQEYYVTDKILITAGVQGQVMMISGTRALVQIGQKEYWINLCSGVLKSI